MPPAPQCPAGHANYAAVYEYVGRDMPPASRPAPGAVIHGVPTQQHLNAARLIECVVHSSPNEAGIELDTEQRAALDAYVTDVRVARYSGAAMPLRGRRLVCVFF